MLKSPMTTINPGFRFLTFGENRLQTDTKMSGLLIVRI